MFSLSLDDRDTKNPVKDWLAEHHPVIMNVVKKLYITHVGIPHIGPKRMCWYFLRAHDGEPITEEYARMQGVTEEEFKSFDAEIDTDNLILLVNWKPVPFSFEEEMEA